MRLSRLAFKDVPAVLIQACNKDSQILIIVPFFIGSKGIDTSALVFIFIVLPGWHPGILRSAGHKFRVEVAIVVVKAGFYKSFIYMFCVQIDSVEVVVDIEQYVIAS